MTTPTKNGRIHTIVVKVENKAGVLARVASLFARRGFNIESLAVAPTAQDGFSRITFTVDVDTAPLEQIVKQLDKLINVVDITELGPDESVSRELMMVTVRSTPETRDDILAVLNSVDAVILHDDGAHLMVSMGGFPDDIDQLESKLEPFGILELQRTGRVALRLIDD